MTEKNYNPEQKQIKTARKMEKVENKIEKPIIHNEKKEEIHPSTAELKKEEKAETKKDEENKKEEIKPAEKKVRKTEATVNGIGLHISSKQSFAICKFIKNREVGQAINELENILLHKKPLPMKGEIPHRRGEIMSGRYPINSIKEFIRLLKNLNANANVNEINNPVIVEARANFASRPYGRFGRVRKKRTNVTIIAKEKITKKISREAKNKK